MRQSRLSSTSRNGNQICFPYERYKDVCLSPENTEQILKIVPSEVYVFRSVISKFILNLSSYLIVVFRSLYKNKRILNVVFKLIQ